MMIKQILLLITLIYLVNLKAGVLEDYYERAGNAKAMAHLQCIRNYLSNETFRLKKVAGDKSSPYTLANRCNSIEGDGRDISVNRGDIAVIVDYTKPSTERRFYILDFDKNKARYYFVSHGRFGNTLSSNKELRPGSNSIREVKYFSNEPGSNASSSGLHITGHTYIGKWSGPDGKRQSMVLHGVEKGINDNSCERATVIHGNSNISENGSDKGVNKMSSGCPMLDYDFVNELTDQIRGFGGHLLANINEARMGGAFYFVFGPREAELHDDHYCNPENLKEIIRVKNDS